jgi:hypothetical protein
VAISRAPRGGPVRSRRAGPACGNVPRTFWPPFAPLRSSSYDSRDVCSEEPRSDRCLDRVLLVVVLLGVVVIALRRRHERRLIGEILGEPYEPNSSKSSPDAPEEDPKAVEARKRATALGRSRRPWS